MKKIILLSLILSACTGGPASAPCKIGDNIADAGASVLAAALNCANHEAVKADMEGVVQKSGLCSQSPIKPQGMSVQSSPVCTAIVNGALGLVFDKGIPANWQCTGGLPKAALTTMLNAICGFIP